MQQKIVLKRQPQVNQRDANKGTHFVWDIKFTIKASFQDLFIRHYESIYASLNQIGKPGFLALALQEAEGVVSALWLSHAPDSINTAIIGRHEQADLFLPADVNISLRHILMMASTGREQTPLLSLMDLRSGMGFIDEQDELIYALNSDGPVFIRAGTYVLFFFPTGPMLAYGSDAKSAWAALPERIFVEKRLRLKTNGPGGQHEFRLPTPKGKKNRGTLVRRLSGPSII